jgi:hypothetical protein
MELIENLPSVGLLLMDKGLLLIFKPVVKILPFFILWFNWGGSPQVSQGEPCEPRVGVHPSPLRSRTIIRRGYTELAE